LDGVGAHSEERGAQMRAAAARTARPERSNGGWFVAAALAVTKIIERRSV
jgi:hypothetical protein